MRIAEKAGRLAVPLSWHWSARRWLRGGRRGGIRSVGSEALQYPNNHQTCSAWRHVDRHGTPGATSETRPKSIQIASSGRPNHSRAASA